MVQQYGGETMLLSIIPVQGVHPADDLSVEIGKLRLGVVTPALIKEHMAVLQSLLDESSYYAERPGEKGFVLDFRRKELEELVGEVALVLREDRVPDLDQESERLLVLAEDALGLLRVALFISGFWRLPVVGRARSSIAVGARSVHGRRETQFVSPNGGGFFGSWEAIPVVLRPTEPDLQSLLRQLVAASASDARAERAYRLLSEALETARSEHFLAWATFALEALVLRGSRRALKAQLTRLMLCITGNEADVVTTGELYTFRSKFVHGEERKKLSPQVLLPRAARLLRRVFYWSLEHDVNASLSDCQQRLAASVQKTQM